MERRRLTVIGATGQLGRALVPALLARPGWEVRALTRSGPDGLEIADAQSIARALDGGDEPPDVVINTSYWATEETEPAFRVNALGPQLLAEACAARGALLVHLSTDYVFSGDACQPYREDDPTEPRSIYGISKLAGEQLVRGTGARHLIVRVSSLYGAGGSRAKRGTSFVSTMLDKARRGERITVPDDQIQSPTYAPDAAACIAELVACGLTGTVHVSNSGWCSWYELAVEIFRQAGLHPDLVPIKLAALPPRPPRPRYSVLGHARLHAAGITPPRAWQAGLHAFLAEAAPGSSAA